MNIFSLAHQKVRAFYQYWFRQKIDFKAVLSDIKEEGTFTGRFAFFCIIGCAIATLGLLLNSPAVIIGAMLISPLMGPIVMQGFSLSMIDIPTFKQSTITIFVGSSLAILISFFIVLFSPITDANAEILARTSPNLFDLLIAIFSGLAAGYTFIKRKGSEIVGVAIATSLMPPLAVMGYGLATWTLWISKGAFFLFMTNLLAISLSVSIISKLYGFGRQKDSRYLIRQTLVAFSILVILGIPLGISLKNIAFEAYVASKSKSIIKSHFTDKLSRLNDFNLSLTKQSINIDAVMITKKYDAHAKKILRKQLEDIFQRPVELTLVQIPLAKTKEIRTLEESSKTKNNLGSPGRVVSDETNSLKDLKAELSESIWFSCKSIHIDQTAKKIDILAKYNPQISLESLRLSEKALRKQYPGWTLRIFPSPQHIPSLYFTAHQDSLTPDNMELLNDIMWALKKWDILEIDIIGYASTLDRNNTNETLAYQRAENVANILKKNGFMTHIKENFQNKDQKSKEKYKGLAFYQRVDVRPHYNTFLQKKAEPE